MTYGSLDDRVQYDGDTDHLDEIVLHGATVTIESMGTHLWDIQARTEDGRFVHLYGYDLREVCSPIRVPIKIDPPLKVCCEWTDSEKRRHYCTTRHSRRSPRKNRHHRCDCGAGKVGNP